jgi:hypothetical protein
MTTQRQFTRQPGTHQLALLTPLEGAAPSPTVSAGLPARPRLAHRADAEAQLTLVRAEGLPPQLRLDHRTRTIGRAGIAELRRILAEGGDAARTAA